MCILLHFFVDAGDDDPKKEWYALWIHVQDAGDFGLTRFFQHISTAPSVQERAVDIRSADITGVIPCPKNVWE